MKRQIVLLSLLLAAAGSAFAGSSGIKLTAPQIDTWTLPAGTPAAVKTAAIDTVNTNISTLFSTLETQLNTDYFSKLHDLNDLSRGFANANAAAFDNASLNSFQTYDLFALMVGGNFGLALPSTDPNKIATAFNDVLDKGDIYLGAATGGAAGQLGVNAGLLVKNLYLSAKFGFIPETSVTGGSGQTSSTVTFKQGMFGIGANYTLLPQVDILFGFIKWRGLSFGSGFVYNANTTTVELGVADQVQTKKVTLGSTLNTLGVADPTLTATVSNIKAKLTVDNSSLVIPLELSTSLQALWFVNVGALAGIDVNFPTSQIKLGGGSNLDIAGLSNATFTPASVAVTATDSKSKGDMFVPRIGASVGLDLALLKLDIPVSYYPTTKAFAIGISGGIVW